MSRYFTLDRLLILASAVWLAALWQLPALHADATAFCATVGVIALPPMTARNELSPKAVVRIFIASPFLAMGRRPASCPFCDKRGGKDLGSS